MDDSQIISLYWDRSESAIQETAAKYENYCFTIAYHILCNQEDAQECVNDAFLKAWNNIPPYTPQVFSAFLGRLVREIAIDRLRRDNSQKRGGGQVPMAMEELSFCIPSEQNVQQEIEQKELTEMIRDFVKTLCLTEKNIFICRYWYFDSIPEISRQFGFSQGKVRSMLHRTRKKLLAYLKERGIHENN